MTCKHTNYHEWNQCPQPHEGWKEQQSSRSLPKWILAHATCQDSRYCKHDDCQLIKGLTIAVEALEKVRDSAIVRGPNQVPTVEDYKAMWRKGVEFSIEALLRIEELGK